MKFPVQISRLDAKLFREISIEQDVSGIGFRFVVPRATSIRKQHTVDKSRSDISLFELESTGGMRISLSRHHQLREYSASYWHQWELLRQGRSTVKSRECVTQVGRVSDILSRKSLDANDYVFRSTVFKNAGIVYFLDVGVPQAEYSGRAAEILSILSSFEILSPNNELFAEKMGRFRLANKPHSFIHPSSWSIESSHGGEIMILNENKGEKMGAIYLSEGRSESDGLTNHLRHIEQDRVQLAESNIQLVPVDSRFDKAYAGNPKAGRDGKHLYIAMLTFQMRDLQASITLLSPTQTDNLIWWAINYRAFEIIRDYFEC